MLRAGFGKVELSAAIEGAPMAGYANRAGGVLGVHDPLHARVLVLEHGATRVALCALDLCGVQEDVVAAARRRIAGAGLVPAGDIFVAATHTHSGPADDAGCWPDGLDGRIADAVGQACASLRPARLGVGWGFLYGHALNRRRLEDPVDPGLLVVRVDATDGTPLGLCYGYACHPVVLGPDNRQASADWPGVSSHLIEETLGSDAIALFLQGACADVNPLTDGVRDQIASAAQVVGEIEDVAYPGGNPDAGHTFEVGDRTGGTFAEAERLGGAVAAEVLRVCGGIASAEVTDVWAQRISVPHPAPSGPRVPSPLGNHFLPRAPIDHPIEAMLIGVDCPGVVLVGQPGEVFARTGARLRRDLRRAGVRHPFVVGYANGWRGYLAPADAFADGGYEVDWARAAGHAETLQDELRVRVLEAVASRAVRGAPGVGAI
jgi:neutral ceramidase